MLNNVQLGDKAPHIINIIIEIPANGPPVKYEIDKASGALFVDRMMSAPMHYPCNYGYLPKTLGEDNDPTDALVVTPYPLLSSSVIAARPVGMLRMEDDAGFDTKIICVPALHISSLYDHVKEISDLPNLLLEQIRHFFEHYKDLEKNRWTKVHQIESKAHAIQYIEDSIQRFNTAQKI